MKLKSIYFLEATLLFCKSQATKVAYNRFFAPLLFYNGFFALALKYLKPTFVRGHSMEGTDCTSTVVAVIFGTHAKAPIREYEGESEVVQGGSLC